MKRSKSIVLLGVPAIASTIACGQSPIPSQPVQPSHLQVCRDQEGRAVDERQCESQGSGAYASSERGGAPSSPMWWYMPYLHGGYAPGAQLRGGQAFAPSGVNRVAPNSVAVRGGFGSMHGCAKRLSQN